MFDPKAAIVDPAPNCLATRVLGADIAAAVIILGLSFAQLAADPFRVDPGKDILFLLGGVAGALLAYSIYSGILHLFSRRYRSRRLFQGWILALAMYGLSGLLLWLFQK